MPFPLRSDNGLVSTSQHCPRLVRGCGLKQEFVTPHSPQPNGMIERRIRSPKEQCIHWRRFEEEHYASRAIAIPLEMTHPSAQAHQRQSE